MSYRINCLEELKIPYLIYKASVKNVPFKDVVGTLGVYSTKDENQESSSKLVFSIVDDKAYNPVVVRDFITSLRFE